MQKNKPIKRLTRLEKLSERLHMEIIDLKKTQKRTTESIDRMTKQTSENIDRMSKETTENINRVEKQWGNVAGNLGDVAEDFFYNGLEFRKRLGGIRFDDISRNVDDIHHREYDIVLTNGKTIGLVEVKHKLHPNDVTKFVNETMPAFKQSFTLAQKLDVVGVVAGLAVPKDAKNLAEEHGLFVLTQSGKNLRSVNSKDFTPKRY